MSMINHQPEQVSSCGIYRNTVINLSQQFDHQRHYLSSIKDMSSVMVNLTTRWDGDSRLTIKRGILLSLHQKIFPFALRNLKSNLK